MNFSSTTGGEVYVTERRKRGLILISLFTYPYAFGLSFALCTIAGVLFVRRCFFTSHGVDTIRTHYPGDCHFLRVSHRLHLAAARGHILLRRTAWVYDFERVLLVLQQRTSIYCIPTQFAVPNSVFQTLRLVSLLFLPQQTNGQHHINNRA